MAIANVTGGTGPYSYLWTPTGQTAQTATGLTAGTYYLTVSDNSCIPKVQTDSVVVPSGGSLTLNSAQANVACFGNATAFASVAPSGGTAPYTYSWNTVPVQTSSTATGLVAGNYTVTVTDASGCSNTSTVVITEPTALGANSSTVTNVLCSGGNNGSATVVANGGTPGYSYLWSPSGGNTVTANNLTAGTYTVTITDLNGCTITSTTVVIQPAVLAANGSNVTNVLCSGDNNGSATVVANGGTPGYTYLWSPLGGNAITASNLTAGTYTVTVTDAHGCNITSTAVITQPTVLAANGSTVTNVSCNGGNDGSVTVAASGGTTTYTYLWSPTGGNAVTANNLAVGTYTVTVTDSHGCTITSTAVIIQPTILAANGSTVTNVSCNGGNNGSATVVASGGTAAYTYLWSPTGGNAVTANNLTAGTYTVTVTDSHGCTITSTAIINQPIALAANGSTVTNVLCTGGNNGTATVVVNGGTLGYTYLWSPSGGNAVTANNLTAGTYTVAVTDSHGCTITSTAIVTEPTVVTAAGSTVTDVSCYLGANGSATVAANGGTPGYIYLWSPTGGNAITANNLAAGTYTVTVTDNNGCSITSTAVITQPTILAANGSTVTNVSCNGGNDGSVTVSANGGTPGYNYLWSPTGGNSLTANNLSTGIYTVTVTDNNGCTISSTVTVTEPTPVVANSSTVMNVSCNGGSNGSSTVVANGGTPGYVYLWSPTGGNSVNANNLSAGPFTVTVTDNNGCSITSTTVITEPTVLAANGSTIKDVSCFNGNNGSAAVAASGGTVVYTYLWSPTGGNAVTANNLSAGLYTVTVTDNNGCSITSTAVITQPTILAANSTALTSVSCFGGNNGSATVAPNGGTPGYVYAWSPAGGNSDTAYNELAGNYTVTVTDANGCSVISNVTITQPPVLALTLSNPVTICLSQSTTISDFPSGGTMPYTFLWSNGDTTSSPSVSPLTTANFSVIVTDADGCTASQSVTINVDPPLNVSATATPQVCFGVSGTVYALGGGGNGGPYSYLWSTGQTSSSFIDTPLVSTTYTVIINDGCSPPVQTTANIIVNPLPAVGFTPVNAVACIPVSVSFTDTANSIPGCTYHWNLGDGTSSTDVNPSHIYNTPGQYGVTLTITTRQGCSSTLSLVNVVTANALPVADFTAPHEMTLNDAAISVGLSNLSEGSNSWLWDFGDNSGASTDFNPFHNYTDTGLYTIQLISYSSAGCPDTAYRTVKVIGEFAIFIPNTFTPNGDGINDEFIARGIYIKDYDMWILDRWGGKIYHSTSLSQPWNGTYLDDGKICQSDVYIYKIKINDVYGKPHEYVGRVTLVR
jgi:gliding motility-associated-like protein